MADLLALLPAPRVPSPPPSLDLNDVDRLELGDTDDPSFQPTVPSHSESATFKRSHSTIEASTGSIVESNVKRLRCQANNDSHDIKPLPRLLNVSREGPVPSQPSYESQTLGSQVHAQNSQHSPRPHSRSPPSTSTTFADSQIRTLTELVLKLTGDMNKRLNRADRQTQDVHSALSRIEGNFARLEDKVDDVSSWGDEVRGELEQAVGPLEERLGGLVSGIKVTVEEQISDIKGDLVQLRDEVQKGIKGDLVEFKEGVEKSIKGDLVEFRVGVKRGFKKDLIKLKEGIERGRTRDLLTLRGEFEKAIKRDHVEFTVGVEKRIKKDLVGIDKGFKKDLVELREGINKEFKNDLIELREAVEKGFKRDLVELREGVEKAFKRDLVELREGVEKAFKRDLVELRERVEKAFKRDLVELRKGVKNDAGQIREDICGPLGLGGVQKHHIPNKVTEQTRDLSTRSRTTTKENMAESHSPSSSPPSSSRWGREASNDVEAETIHRPQEVAERLDSALELNNITARKIDEDALSILLESDGCVDKYRDALEQEMEDEDTVRQEVEASLMELGRDSEDESEHTESQRVEIENNGNSSKASSVSHVSGEDHHAKDAPSDSTGTSSRRQSCRARKSVDYRFHPLNGYKARLSKPKPVKIRQRAFNGKTMFATKCLKPSDGKARGYGVWPPKNAHTKKGREQDITCDICKGQVHWMCAGFKNDDPAPTGEWHCPDCREQIKRGVPPKTIEVAPQYRCIRGNCVLRDKQRVERVEGDEEEYVVELIAGRKAISRNEDKSRNFVYLVKWWGYGYDDMTWEPPSNLEHHSGEIDDFVKEAARLELPLHKRVTLLAEARKYWDENGEERE